MLFLLFQEHCNVDKEKEKFENWLETHGQSILPYIIVCGSVETVFETYVVLKSPFRIRLKLSKLVLSASQPYASGLTCVTTFGVSYRK